MDSVVARKLLSCDPPERARLLGIIRVFITHVDFVNTVTNIDVNSTASIYRWTKPLAAFNSIESLWLQVEDWLRG